MYFDRKCSISGYTLHLKSIFAVRIIIIIYMSVEKRDIYNRTVSFVDRFKILCEVRFLKGKIDKTGGYLLKK